jgi:hypothetical protein
VALRVSQQLALPASARIEPTEEEQSVLDLLAPMPLERLHTPPMKIKSR